MDVQPQPLDEYVYLTGRPSVRDLISFARRHKVNGARPDKEPLIRDWRQAHEYIQELQATDKGLADDAELQSLPEDMLAVADAELQTAGVRNGWEGLAYRWRLVELDRVVVFQKTINLRFIGEIKATLPAVPSHDDIIRVAAGKAWQPPPVRVTRSEEFTFICVSNSNDMRILEIDTLDPASIQGYQPPGHAGAVIGICVGFTTNMLSAIQVRNRLILINGSHRAYALRSIGVTHVPCLVLGLSREEEFDLKAPEAVKENRDLYLRHPRPPLFKDYFDPRLHTILRTPRANQLVQLQIGYQKIGLPVL